MSFKKIPLRRLFIVIFVLFSLLVVGIVIFTTNILLKDEFLHYVDQTQSTEVKEITKVTQEQLESKGEISEDFILTSDNYVQEGFIINVIENNKVVFDAFDSPNVKELEKKYKKTEEKLASYFDSKYAIYEQAIKVNNKDFELQIYIYRPAFLNDEGFKHLDSLNQIFLYVGATTLTIALIIGILVSRMLVRPFEELIQKIQRAKKGEFEKVVESNSRIVEYQKLEDSFNNLSTSLQNQKQMRKNLSADLSHEIRTPLTAMSLILENIEEGIWSMDDQIVGSLLEEVKRIQYLIEDIHKLEQVEAELYNLEIEEVNIEDVIKHVVSVFEAALTEKNITINYQLQQKKIRADKYRMTQVVTNILSNAIKYTEMNGMIVIQTVKNGENFVLSIKDNGIGISKIDQNKIFNRFYRSLNEKATQEVGLGVGLTISKEIINAHNGQLLLFSTLDKGTEVIIVLSDR